MGRGKTQIRSHRGKRIVRKGLGKRDSKCKKISKVSEIKKKLNMIINKNC